MSVQEGRDVASGLGGIFGFTQVSVNFSLDFCGVNISAWKFILLACGVMF